MHVAILGLGSVLMGDDAVGPHVVRRLEQHCELPADVALVDVGTPGPELFHYILGLDALIVVDSVRAEGPPGSLHLYRKEEILAASPPARLSPHDPSLRDALLTAELVGPAPGDVLLVGVTPGQVALGTRLTPPVAAALPLAESAVVAELERLGIEVTARRAESRPSSGESRIWWERAPT